jgi:hypothetical protein
MRILRTLFGLTAVLAVIGATWVFAQQRKPGSHVLLSPEGYIEIQQLYSFYARDVDPGSARDASWMFTPDGVFQSSARTAGQAALKDMYTKVAQNQAAGIRHFNSTYVIVGAPEGARGSSYMMELQRKGEGKPIEVTLFGKYEDRLVKTRDGWRFKERIWTADSFRGSTQPVSPSPIPASR